MLYCSPLESPGVDDVETLNSTVPFVITGRLVPHSSTVIRFVRPAALPSERMFSREIGGARTRLLPIANTANLIAHFGVE